MTDRPPLDVSPIPEQWRPIAAYIAVSLILSLIGMGIAADFERVTPTTTTTDEPLITRTPSTTTTTVAGATTTTAASSTTLEAAAPGALQVSTESIDFGADSTTGQFQIGNAGATPGDWTMTTSSEALSVSIGSGTLEPGQSVTIDVALERNLLASEGEISESLTVTWSGGEAVVAAVGSNVANPIIHNPQASPAEVKVDSGCGGAHTTVSARIRDTSPLESVVVRWSPDGSGGTETAMNSIGDDMFEAVIGPFSTAQTADLRIVAFDALGNAGGAGVTVTVVPCP